MGERAGGRRGVVSSSRERGYRIHAAMHTYTHIHKHEQKVRTDGDGLLGDGRLEGLLRVRHHVRVAAHLILKNTREIGMDGWIRRMTCTPMI